MRKPAKSALVNMLAKAAKEAEGNKNQTRPGSEQRAADFSEYEVVNVMLPG